MVEEHLPNCEGCAADLEALRHVLGAIQEQGERPSDLLPAAYWTAFANEVEARIAADAARTLTANRFEEWWTFLTGRWKIVLGITTAAAVTLIAVLILRSPPPEPATTETAAAVSVDTSAARMGQYLRRSKSLLVGVFNMPLPDSGITDLSAERKTSRELVEEARALGRESLDPRGKRLVGDLQKIFIELANASDHEMTPTVELLRSNIERDNLLFKVRMAETAYGNAQFIPAGMRR
jgi:hypothetical protein